MPNTEFQDWADSPRASEGFDYAQVDRDLDGFDAAVLHTNDMFEEVLEFGRRLVSYIRGKDRCRLTVDCLYIALGDAALEGVSMTLIAQRHGVSKAAVSKRAREIREDLHLPRTGYNKSEAACVKYASTNYSRRNLEHQ